MKLFGIMVALMNGYVLHIVRSEDGSQEITMKKVYKNATVPGALISANLDFSRTGFSDNKLPADVTDTTSPEDDLDYWIRKGGTLDAYHKDKKIIVELTGYDIQRRKIKKIGTHPENLTKAIENAFTNGAKRIE